MDAEVETVGGTEAGGSETGPSVGNLRLTEQQAFPSVVEEA
jgi:hypothetical protein